MNGRPISRGGGRILLWLVVSAPLAVQLWRYQAEAVFYGEILHWTGLHATQLLLVTLAVTPLARFFPRAAFVAWLRRVRRDLGLLTFVYAAAHTLVYLVRIADASRIVDEALEAGLLTGWIAMLLFTGLAVTSNNVSVRKLGRRWRRLHRLVYAAAVLTIAHWVLTAFDPTTAFVYAAILALLLLLRVRAQPAIQ